MSSQRTSKLNRFYRARVIRVGGLPATMLAAIVINGGLFIALLISLWLLWSYRSSVSEAQISKLAPLPSPVALSTDELSATQLTAAAASAVITNSSTPTIQPSFTPIGTWTPIPTWTPPPTWTPIPTWTASPSPTATPTATPKLYTAGFLQDRVTSGSDIKEYVNIQSDYSFGFYRAICHDVPGQKFIQPRVISSLDLHHTGYYWKLDNELSGYDYTSELDFTDDTTFYLSDNASLFSVRLYWHDDQISDRVALDFPESCRAAMLIFVEASPRTFDVEVENVGVVSGYTGKLITSTQVITR